MDTIRFRMIVPLGLLGVSLALTSASGADDKATSRKDTGKTAAKKPAANTAKKAAPAGMIAVKDAQTGEFRAPTAEEAAALAPAAITQRNAAAVESQSEVGTDGAITLHLDDSSTVYSVAKRNPDGTISFGEATGAANAKAAATSRKPAPKPAAKGGLSDR